jgi:hypothetical protein
MPIPRLTNPSFPSACILDQAGTNLIEVHLIADVGRGRGNAVVQQASQSQRNHRRFVDDLDEPSTCIGELRQNDVDHSSLYTFVVESEGHPFHRHASARIFTAVSGADGTQLRFSSASLEGDRASLNMFFENAHCIDIPANCLFTVRFAGGVWHQFVPAKVGATSPALFAVSCHPDDLQGIHNQYVRSQILEGKASIPLLTEVLPVELANAVSQENFASRSSTFQQLQFVPPPMSLLHARTVSMMRQLKREWQKVNPRLQRQFMPSLRIKHSSLFSRTRQQPVPQHSLIWNQLSEKKSYHLDHFELLIPREELLSFRPHEATGYMRDLLQAFTDHSPLGVTRLMQLRNAIVKPFGLRTSSVGCPVSSLLADQAQDYFLQRFPIWEQHMNADNTEVQVVLGADDKHLEFRSVVMVEIIEEGIVISLSNRVAYRNFFGHFYMTCIRGIHQAYIVPKMLSTAASQLCSLESTVERHQCRCMRLLLGA